MYSYEEEKKKLMTDAGQRAVLATAFAAKELCSRTGVVTGLFLVRSIPHQHVSDSYGQAAVVQRLVEVGYIAEVPQAATVPSQDRVYRWTGP